MSKRIKKGLYWLVVAVLSISMLSVFSLIGCKEEAVEETEEVEEAVEEAAASEDTPEVVLGFSPLTMEIAAFQDVYKGVQLQAKEDGVKLILDDPQMDAAKQVTGVENMISAGANVICIVSIDIPSAETVVEYCKEKGVAVISLVSAFEGADVSIGIDEYTYGLIPGTAAADYITKNLGGKANVAILDADSLGGDLLLRSKGMVEGVQSAGEGVIIVARTTAFEESKALSAMENILLENPDCNYVVTSNEPGAYGALAAIESAGKEVFISSIGDEDRILGLIEQGKVISGVDPAVFWMGEQMVTVAKSIIRGETYEKKYLAPVSTITIDNVQQKIENKANYGK